MTDFIQYALSVGNSKPGQTGNTGYSRDRQLLIESNRGGMYSTNPHTLYGQSTDRRWHVVEQFENLR